MMTVAKAKNRQNLVCIIERLAATYLLVIAISGSVSQLKLANALPAGSQSTINLPLDDKNVNYFLGEPFHNRDQAEESNKFDHEIVQISIKAMLTNGALKEYPLNTRQDLAELQQDITQFNETIEINLIYNSSQPIILYLKRNSFVITKNFVRKYFSDTGKPIIKYASDKDVALSYCYFNGEVLKNKNSLTSLSLCDGVKGIIEASDKVYTIEPHFEESKLVHLIRNQHASSIHGEEPVAMSCGTEDEKTNSTNYHPLRHRERLARDVRLPAGSTTSTRYVEIYVVMDYSLYRRTGSVDATIMRAINIINYASGLYRQLDIYLALVGVEVWNDRNKITYARASGSRDYDPGMILTEFNKYRHFKINWVTKNDGGQLFSAEKFAGGLIGKGSTTAICTQTASGGVTRDAFEDNYIRAATTMAHELGHNLGLPHSNSDMYSGKDCQCEDPDNPNFKDCIMHSSSNPYQQSKRWSQCNKDKLHNDFKEKNLDHCLKNIPEQLQKVGNSPVCGNFFVEQGEECDCGLPAECDSKCCDPTTCKLNSNATCATGSCCNMDTCTVRPKSYPCREIQDSECDLAELCGGDSEWCPIDTYKLDGTECSNRGPGYCHSGKCSTHDSQCHLIWGAESAKKSEDICYERFNNKSRYFGNCGWTSVTEDYDVSTVRKNFKPCATKQDQFCGLLHCQYDTSEVSQAQPRIINFPLILYPQRWKGKMCAVSSFDVGYQVYDPGQVPNGAKCGDNSMCVNSKCESISKQSGHCSCNGRGVCNQLNECHCDIGWAPPFCEEEGLGGSLTSNPPVIDGTNISLLAGLIAFFGGITPMAIILAVICYCRRHELKTKFHSISSRFGRRQVIRQKTEDTSKVQVSVLDSNESHSPPVLRKYPLNSVVDSKRPDNAGPLTPVTGYKRPDNAGPLNPVTGYKRPDNAGPLNPVTGYKRPDNTGPLKPITGYKRNPDNAVSSRKEIISTPVLQSTTNSSPQVAGSVKQLTPSRAAPPPPNIPNRPVKNSGSTYENVKPPTAIKPPTAAKPAKPPTAPKPAVNKNKPLVPPKVLPKPPFKY